MDKFLLLLRAERLPLPEREYQFASPRRWRFDYAWPDYTVALEREGGIWIRGRHSRGQGFERDCQKYAEAVLLGWRVFRASTRQMDDGTALGWVKRAFAL